MTGTRATKGTTSIAGYARYGKRDELPAQVVHASERRDGKVGVRAGGRLFVGAARRGRLGPSGPASRGPALRAASPGPPRPQRALQHRVPHIPHTADDHRQLVEYSHFTFPVGDMSSFDKN